MINDDYKQFCLDIDCDDLDTYIKKLVLEKSDRGMLGWQDIANIVFEKFGVDHSRHWYYRNYGDFLVGKNSSFSVSAEDELTQKLLMLKKERVKVSDERTQNNAYIRKLAREETFREIAIEAVQNIEGRIPLPTYDSIYFTDCDKEAILLLSDWHYGFDFKNSWNTYNTDVAKERIKKLYEQTVQICAKNNVQHINVLNLADLIAGRIHLTIRLESRIDVITQIMEVSEILAEFLNSLSQYFKVDYYSCIDNHSRVEPNKSDSLDLESLCRITDWYLKERVGKNGITIHDNRFGEDIITLSVLGHQVLGCHGDKDKQQTVIEKMTLLTRQSYDLICTAHMHHFSADEHTGTVLISNGALMGTDTFAKNLRLHSRPSQTLIISSKDNVTDGIFRIVLD